MEVRESTMQCDIAKIEEIIWNIVPVCQNAKASKLLFHSMRSELLWRICSLFSLEVGIIWTSKASYETIHRNIIGNYGKNWKPFLQTWQKLPSKMITINRWKLRLRFFISFSSLKLFLERVSGQGQRKITWVDFLFQLERFVEIHRITSLRISKEVSTIWQVKKKISKKNL